MTQPLRNDSVPGRSLRGWFKKVSGTVAGTARDQPSVGARLGTTVPDTFLNLGWLWLLLKWSLFVLVLVFVGKRAWQIWNQEQLAQVRVSWGWLVLAGAVYAAAWLPSVWFWRRLVSSLGGDVSFCDAARAYYCGHLGKYVPGKAMVLVIRTGMMKPLGVRLAAGALSATYETLLMMAVGAGVGVALLPFLSSDAWRPFLPSELDWLRQWPWLILAVVVLMGAALLPLVSRFLSFVARKATPSDFTGPDQVGAPSVSARLLYEGCLAFVVGWTIQGLSLGCTIQSLSTGTFDMVAWPFWTAAVALSTFIGFIVVFAPGGLGVREGVMIETLSPAIGGPHAILAAVLLRAVSFVTEILIAATLYYLRRPRPDCPCSEKETQL